MKTDATYTLLIRSLSPGCDPFDGHVLACAFAIAAQEAGPRRSLAESIGVSGKFLRSAIAEHFPDALTRLEEFGLDSEVVIDAEEQSLRTLLQRSRSTPGAFGSLLVALVARRATQPNHLWQDLGLTCRGELSALMQRHFAPLATRNSQDMKWKKFFYRMICRDDSYRLCAAPSCSECCDFTVCFGDESGESRLAKTRRQIETQIEGNAVCAV
jgi:nitrogen fixation protein NifQ